MSVFALISRCTIVASFSAAASISALSPSCSKIGGIVKTYNHTLDTGSMHEHRLSYFIHRSRICARLEQQSEASLVLSLRREHERRVSFLFHKMVFKLASIQTKH
jgi:hypothetical protein